MYKKVEKSFLFRTLRMRVLSGDIYLPKGVLHGVKRGNKREFALTNIPKNFWGAEALLFLSLIRLPSNKINEYKISINRC